MKLNLDQDLDLRHRPGNPMLHRLYGATMDHMGADLWDHVWFQLSIEWLQELGDALPRREIRKRRR